MCGEVPDNHLAWRRSRGLGVIIVASGRGRSAGSVCCVSTEYAHTVLQQCQQNDVADRPLPLRSITNLTSRRGGGVLGVYIGTGRLCIIPLTVGASL